MDMTLHAGKLDAIPIGSRLGEGSEKVLEPSCESTYSNRVGGAGCCRPGGALVLREKWSSLRSLFVLIGVANCGSSSREEARVYCHDCGAKAHGNFCAHCGTKLIAAAPASSEEQRSANSPTVVASLDWADEVRYEVLVGIPEVRDSIARHASRAGKHLSAEDFLELCDKAFVPLSGASLAKIGALAVPVYSAFGVKTNKTRKELLPMPPGRVMVAVLCSLVGQGQELIGVEQAEDGCLLRATIPSDLWSFQGECLIQVERQDQGTLVEVATVIPGQLYDWGKSNRFLTHLFNEIKSTK